MPLYNSLKRMIRPTIYGIDLLIETQLGHGVSARNSWPADLAADDGSIMNDLPNSRIVGIGFSTPEADELFEGDESALLARLDRRLAIMPPGILATWSGATIDLPLIKHRAAQLGCPTGMISTPAPRHSLNDRSFADPHPDTGAVPMHFGPPLKAKWYQHRHVDLSSVADHRNVSLIRQDQMWSRYHPIDNLSSLSVNSRTGPASNGTLPSVAASTDNLDAMRGAYLARTYCEHLGARAQMIADRVSTSTVRDSYTWTFLSPDLVAARSPSATGRG